MFISDPHRPILAIDPGLKNFGAVLLEDIPNTPYVSIINYWEENLSGRINPDPDRMKEVMDDFMSLVPSNAVVLIEYQPPLNTNKNPALVRWNSWIEGYLMGFLTPRFETHIVYPISVKHHFGTLTGDYRLNKQVALAKANELLEVPILSDHLADCVLMGVYWLEKGHKKFSTNKV